MNKKLWQKSGAVLHPLVEKYTVGLDYIYDNQLIKYDIIASQAHAFGLNKIGILTAAEYQALNKALSDLLLLVDRGKFVVTLSDEDCHTAIENYLVNKLGVVGKKIHTGRSRNDQVLAAVRLYSQSQFGEIKKQLKILAGTFLRNAQKYQAVAMPGYSHTQQAMITTVGHYFAAVAESLIDDLEVVNFVSDFVGKSPLGSAAGFGVALPLARGAVAKKMGLNKLQINSLYCQNSRGKYESLCLESLSQIMLTLGRLATDLILFTSREFGYFKFGDQLVTGSSIMPQKRNLDAMEILRAQVKVVAGNEEIVKNIGQGLLSGYNRDLQLIKKPLFDSFSIVKDSIAIVQLYIQNIQVDRAVLASKIQPDIASADWAVEKSKQGIPFREAYAQTKAALSDLDNTSIDWTENIKNKVSLGAAGNLGLNLLRSRWQKL